MIRRLSVGRRYLFHTAVVAFAFASMILMMASPALALGTAVFSAASPASGAAILTTPSWVSVKATDTSPILSATLTVNGLPAAVNIDRPVGHFAYAEDQESYVWVADDLRVAKLMAYDPGNRLVPGLNTVVATVAGAGGTSTYSWTFNYGSATTLASVSPAADAVLPASPSAISASLVSPSSSFTSTTMLDGALAATVYSAGTKTFTHTPGTALSAGPHTVAFTARDSSGGTVARTWSFTVRPPMSTGEDCVSCHAAFPAAHRFSGCADCHTHGYTVPGGSHGAATPTAAGCGGDGTQQASACHRLDHASDSKWGIWGSGPFTCTTCHSVANANVPRHTDASATAAHASTSTGCGPCHSESLLTEHAKYPRAATIKYQCDLCHGPTVRTQVKDAIAAKLTNCSACHVAADHVAAHAVTVPPECSTVGCHTGSSLTSIHAVPGCDGCHASGKPEVIDAIATGKRDCAACHGADPHPVAVHLAGGPCVTSGCHAANVSILHAAGPGCAACHAAGKTPSLVCTSCHTGALHVTANHTSSETCKSCHNVTNLISIHGDNCATCHPTPRTGLTWNRKCSDPSCHPTSHTAFTTHHGEHNGNGTDCWDCHDITPTCAQCHSVYDRTPPVTSSNAVGPYSGAATITLTRVDAGGSGIRKTYYQLDGGILSTGTVVAVLPPASGATTHTLDFWSTDNAYNTEVHKRAVFSVSTP